MALATAKDGKTGKYLPHESERNYPWSKITSDIPETYTLESLTSRIPQTQYDPTLAHFSQDSVFLEKLAHLPNNKAPGPDGFPNELIKHLTPDLKICLHKMFILLYATGFTPTIWKKSTTVLLAKPGDRDLKDLRNWRPISLANSLYKLYTSMVTETLTHYAEEHNILSPVQEGFRRFHNTHRQLRHLISIIEDAKLTTQNLYALYVDFSSAFNCVDHDKLLCIMYDLGFTPLAIEVVKNIYMNSITQVSSNVGLTEPIEIHRGTLQGDTLSPFLFLVFIEPLLRWLHAGGRGYKYGSIEFDCDEPGAAYRASSGYADDLVILTNNPRDMMVQAAKITAFTQWSHLQANAKKCAVTAILHADAKNKLCKSAADFQRISSKLKGITIDGDPIPVYRSDQPYKYLGIQITLTLNWKHQIASVRKLITTKGTRLVHSFASPLQRIKVLQRCIIPAVTYSFPLAPYSRHDIEQFDSCITSIAKRCMNINRVIPNCFCTCR